MTRAKELIAIVLIGDGVVGALMPGRHVRRWESGPQSWRRMMRPFSQHPQMTRVVAIAEVLVGSWYAYRLPPPLRKTGA